MKTLSTFRSLGRAAHIGALQKLCADHFNPGVIDISPEKLDEFVSTVDAFLALHLRPEFDEAARRRVAERAMITAFDQLFEVDLPGKGEGN